VEGAHLVVAEVLEAEDVAELEELKTVWRRLAERHYASTERTFLFSPAPWGGDDVCGIDPIKMGGWYAYELTDHPLAVRDVIQSCVLGHCP
jgi:hypothetical protein